MTPFVPKKIKQLENLGEELRLARNKKELSIDQAAEILKIRKEYLLALEMEDFNTLPSGLYGKNYLRSYAKFLQIPDKEIQLFLKQLEREMAEGDPFPNKLVDQKKFLVFPKIIKNILISLAVLACFLYLLLYFKNLVSSPTLEIIHPKENLVTSESSIEIIGRADPGSDLSINEESILADEDGYFTKLVNLKKGMNTIRVGAKKKYSSENILIRQVLLN